MTATTTPIFIATDFAQSLIRTLFDAFDKATKQVYQIAWSVLISILEEHWLSILIFLILILAVSIIFAIKGRWGMLGSVLYHYLYFGTLFVVGSIFGPNIFVSNFFSVACTIILYPICYWIVGWILDKTGLHRKRF